VVVLGLLITQSRQRKDKLALALEAVQHEIRIEDWSAASKRLQEAREQAGNDTVLQKRVERELSDIREDIESDLDTVAEQLEASEVQAAGNQLEQLPDPGVLAGNEVWGELRSRLLALHGQHEQLRQEVSEFADDIRQLLNTEEYEQALQSIATAEGDFQTQALATMDLWRSDSLRKASRDVMPIGLRREHIQGVMAVQPDENDLARIEELRQAISKQEEKLSEQLDELATGLERGDHQSIAEQSVGLRTQLSGSRPMERFRALEEAAKDRRQLLRSHLVACYRAIEEADRERLLEVTSQVRSIAKQSSQAAEAEHLEQAAQVGEAIAESTEEPTYADELREINQLLAQVEPEWDAMKAALNARKASIQRIEANAARDIARVRSLREEGEGQRAREMLRTLSEGEGWARTAASVDAEEEFRTLKRDLELQQARMATLYEAMRADRLPQVLAITRELGLSRLPLMVRSEPDGAEVLRDGEAIGKTPHLIQDISSDRIDDEFTLRMDGYAPAAFSIQDAVAGWRIHVELERVPAQVVEVNSAVANIPSAIDGELWLAGSKQAFAVAQDGSVRNFTYDGASVVLAQSLRQPVYARPVMLDGAVCLTTRDLFALLVEAGDVKKLPLAAPSNFPLVRYRSPFVNDLSLAVVASVDGRLVANHIDNNRVRWSSDSGAAFAGSPVVAGEQILAARSDGILVAHGGDDGNLRNQHDIQANVLTSWADGQKLVALCTDRICVWDGQSPPSMQRLPRSIKAGSPEVLVGIDGTTLLKSDGDGSWVAVGQIGDQEAVRSHPVRWSDHAVVSTETGFYVLGERSFVLRTESGFLSPAVIDGQLAAVELSGRVRFFKP